MGRTAPRRYMMSIRATILPALMTPLILAATPLLAATDFSGQWVFHYEKSENVEMMRNVQVTLSIQQTPEALTMTEVSTVRGREATRTVHYDLTGKPEENQSAMGDASQTTSKWVGEKLETSWIHPGAVAGTQVVSTETRSLSADGKTMRDEFARANRPTFVFIYEKR
jgi:hypothetical protein